MAPFDLAAARSPHLVYRVSGEGREYYGVMQAEETAQATLTKLARKRDSHTATLVKGITLLCRSIDAAPVSEEGWHKYRRYPTRRRAFLAELYWTVRARRRCRSS